jgi:benzylsuccinate CoA-transferase BbsE subunit
MDKDWSACNRNDMTPEEWEHYKALFWRFFAQRPKAEFEDQALKRGFIGFRLASPSDSLESPQLQARDFWRYVTYPELGGVTIAHPGRIYRSETLPWKTPRHAPSLGEHNVEIYQGELGFSNQQMSILKQAKVI